MKKLYIILIIASIISINCLNAKDVAGKSAQDLKHISVQNAGTTNLHVMSAIPVKMKKGSKKDIHLSPNKTIENIAIAPNGQLKVVFKEHFKSLGTQHARLWETTVNVGKNTKKLSLKVINSIPTQTVKPELVIISHGTNALGFPTSTEQTQPMNFAGLNPYMEAR